MQRRTFMSTAMAWALAPKTALAEGAYYSGYPHEIRGWRAVYFTPREFASKGNGYVHVEKDMVAALDRVRSAVGHPIHITSGYRDPAHNARVGGAPRSRHMVGDAVDINLRKLTAEARHRLMWHLLSEGFTSFGSYARAPDMLHADRRPNARIWRHGGGAHPAWFQRALKEWRWVRDVGPTRQPVSRFASK